MASLAGTETPTLPIETPETGSAVPTVATGALLAAGGAVCRLSEQVQHTPVPNVIQEAVNSGAHPIVGFSAAVIAAGLGAEKLSGKLKVAAYMGATSIVNTLVEFSQDEVLHAPIKFWERPYLVESAKDLTAALLGAGIYKAVRKLRK